MYTRTLYTSVYLYIVYLYTLLCVAVSAWWPEFTICIAKKIEKGYIPKNITGRGFRKTEMWNFTEHELL